MKTAALLAGLAAATLLGTKGFASDLFDRINAGRYQMTIDDDGWTARTADGSLSAQYEHTIAITADGPVILTEQ